MAACKASATSYPPRVVGPTGCRRLTALDDRSNFTAMTRNQTRERIIRAGGAIIAEQGFGPTGINAVLRAAGVPKGSFYHYFASKDDFGLAVIDSFARDYAEKLERSLGDTRRSPLERLHAYFRTGIDDMQACACGRGCLFGNLGQELAAQSELFRTRLDRVFADWEARLAACIAAAREAGEIRSDVDPAALAGFTLAGWEGAILRAKLIKSVTPMERFVQMLFREVLQVRAA